MDLVQTNIAMQSWSPLLILDLLIFGERLFGVSFIFILKFLGQILALFAASALISKLLKLDKTYDNLHHPGND